MQRTEKQIAHALVVHRSEQKRKVFVFEQYGGAVCACCGETEVSFLALDHIAGDGAAHRRTIPGTSGHKVYRWVVKNNYPPGFQVLCFNCNFSKHFLGECIHKKGKQHATDERKSQSLTGLGSLGVAYAGEVGKAIANTIDQAFLQRAGLSEAIEQITSPEAPSDGRSRQD